MAVDPCKERRRWQEGGIAAQADFSRWLSAGKPTYDVTIQIPIIKEPFPGSIRWWEGLRAVVRQDLADNPNRGYLSQHGKGDRIQDQPDPILWAPSGIDISDSVPGTD